MLAIQDNTIACKITQKKTVILLILLRRILFRYIPNIGIYPYTCRLDDTFYKFAEKGMYMLIICMFFIISLLFLIAKSF